MSKQAERSKFIVSAVAGILLLCLYIAIFVFSSQDGEKSGSLSYKVSEKCVEIVDSMTGNQWTGTFKESLAEYFEHPIRKLAHFAEYAFMGILVFVMWRPWMSPGKGLFFLTILWVFLSATVDELHQSFVPGRSCNILDILLDTCGGIFGMLCCVRYDKLRMKKRIKGLKKQVKNKPEIGKKLET